jgi:ribosomal-protein-alanine N-acetyltransferase
MREADVPEVAGIERASHPLSWPAVYFRRLLREGCAAWVVSGGGVLAGYAVVGFDEEDAHRLNLAVAAAWRRRGLGSRLLTAALDAARRGGAERVLLEVRASNRGAQRLYPHAGFRVVQRRPRDYPYPHGGEDALVMARPIHAFRG